MLTLIILNANIVIPTCMKDSGNVREIMHLACSLCSLIYGESLIGACLLDE